MRAPSHRYTWEQYLLLEGDSELKHEFWNGEIYAMAGGTAAHSALAVNVTVELGSQLRGRACRVYNSDLRLRVQTSGLATYPDVSVICGDLVFEPSDKNNTTVLNPTVIVEVLSDSTEEYDRGGKFEHYQRVESLKEYVLVSQHEPLIELFRRRGEGAAWERYEARAGERVELTSIGCRLETDAVYAGVKLAAG